MNPIRDGRHAVPGVVAALVLGAATAAAFAVGFWLAEAFPSTPAVTSPVPSPTATVAASQPGATTGPQFVVHEDGDDVASGDPGHPWRTLAHALASVPPGATIRLGPGTFQAADVNVPGVRVLGVGDASVITGGLVIRADGVEIAGVMITGQEEAYAGGVTVTGARDAVIRDSLIAGNPFGVFLEAAQGARLTGNRITDNAYGIEVHGLTSGTVIAGNEIVDNDRALDGSRGAGGLNLYFTIGGIDVTGNRIEDNDEVAIEIYAASDVRIADNRVGGSNDMIETGTEAGTPCRGLRITGNTFYNRRPDDSVEERGVYLRCATDATVEWNTFAGLDRFAIGLFAGEGEFNGPLENVSIRHNILAGGRAFSLDSELSAGVIADEDVIMPCRTGGCPVLGRDVAYVASAGSGTRIWTEFQDWTGFEANGRFGDPRFVDAAAHDYRLAPGSPARGRAGATEAPAATPTSSPTPTPSPSR